MKSGLGWVLVVLCALLAVPARADVALEVQVLGGVQKAPVVGARVELTNAAIGYKGAATTNATGRVRFASLSTAGEYTVTVPASGDYDEQRFGGITLRTNFDRSVTVQLAPLSELTEDVEVEAGAGVARINTLNAEVSSTLQRDELAALPVEGRDLTRALYRLPNVTQATGFYPEAPNVSINGANSLFSNYMIDGLDNNENFLGGQKFAIPTGFVQDVTVLTNNYSSEFGRTGNGILNVTSRSGSNALSGEVYYITRPGPRLDASPAFAQRDLSGNQVKAGFGRDQIGGTIAGPIVKDKTFYAVDIELTRDDKDNLLTSPALGVNGTVSGKNRFDYYSGKLTQQWSDRFRSALRLNVGRVEIERQGGGLDGGTAFPSAGSAQDRDSLLLAWNNHFTQGRWTLESNLQYSTFRWNYGRALNGRGPQANVLDQGLQSLALLGHPGFVFDDREKTWQLQQKASYVAGAHLLRGGLELLSSDFALLGGGNVDGNYTVVLTPQQIADLRGRNRGTRLDIGDIPADAFVQDYSVELRTKSFGKRQTITSLFAEDLWSASDRLNLTFSLRYDYDNLSKGGASRGDRNNWAPRVAFNYQLTPKMSLRGGAGLFYDKILYAVYSDALQQNSTSLGYRSQIAQLIDLGILPRDTDIGRVTFAGNLVASFSGGSVDYLQGPSPGELQAQREIVHSGERRILNPRGYDNPYTEQFSLGYQWQLAPQSLFYVDLVRTQSYRLFRLRDLNAPAPFPIDPDDVQIRTVAEANATRPVDPTIPGGATNIVMSETAGEARYWALNATLIGDRGAKPLSYRLSYTLSRLTNNTDDINFKAQDANDFTKEWGPSLNDRRHVINGLIAWNPWRTLTLSAAALLQSGQPINRIPSREIVTTFGTSDLNGDGRSFGAAYVGNSDRQPGERRNSDRLSWSKSLDLSAAYRIKLKDAHLEVRADIFNALNTVNLSGYSNNATQSNQIQQGPPADGIVRKNSGPPRQFQFGVAYAF